MHRVTIQQRQIFPEPARGRISLPQLPDMYIQLPKPQPSRKIISNSTQQSGESQYKPPFLQEDTPRFQQQLSISQQGSGLLVNHSAFSRHNQGSKSDKQIILDWVKNIMQRRGLLGLHWQEGLSKKRHEFIKSAFMKIKSTTGKSYAQLNTESRHNRPIQRRQNHMIFQGLEKASNIIGSQLYTIKYKAFGNIRRSGISLASTPHSNLAQHFSVNGKQSIFVWHGNEGNDKGITEPFAKRMLSPSVYKREDSEAVKLEKIKSAQHLNYIANQYALSPIPVMNANPESRRMRKKINESQPQCIIVAKTIQINHTTNNSYAELKNESKDTSRQKEAHQHFQKQYLPVKMQEIRKSTSKLMPNNKYEQVRPQSQQNMQLRSHQVSQLRLPEALNTVRQSEIRVRPVSASPNVSIKISYMGQQTKCIAPSRSIDCFNQYYAQSKKVQQTAMIPPKGLIRTGSHSGTSSPSARYAFDRLSGLPTPVSTPSSTPNPKSPQRKSIQQSPFPSTSRI